MVAARTILTSSFTHRIPAGIPAAGPVLPYEMEKALVDFGLMSAFRSRPMEQRRDYVRRVSGSPDEDARRDQIADVLDELALGSKAYAGQTGW